MVAEEVDFAHALGRVADVLFRKTVFDPPFGRRIMKPLYWTIVPGIWRRCIRRISTTGAQPQTRSRSSASIRVESVGSRRGYTRRITDVESCSVQ